MTTTMEAFVYLMCAFTALVCCGLLARGYRNSRTSMLLWSSLCFFFLTLENLILYIDRVWLGPDVDLALQRLPFAILAVFCLLYGAIWKNA